MTDAPVIAQRTTVEEFEVFLQQSENADRRFELIDGEIVEKAMPGYLHQWLARVLFRLLDEFVQAHDLGEVMFELRHRPNPEEQYNDRTPDLSFTTKARLQPIVPGAVTQMSDLCIAIQSPGDLPREMRDKAAYYLANGAQQVWLVFTQKPLIEVMFPNGNSDFYYPGDTLLGGDLLPGFEARIDDIFRTRE
jgi:Uma2 family endonuclease